MPTLQAITTEIPLDVFAKLEGIAQAKHCSSACIMKEAVEEYVTARDYLEQKVSNSLEASALGRTQSHEDVKKMVRGMGFHVD